MAESRVLPPLMEPDHHLFPISHPPPTLCTTASIAPSWALSWEPQELRQALLRTTLELESTRAAAQAELLRMDGHALRLARLLEVTTRERDEARLQCRSLLHLLIDQQQHQFMPTISSEEEDGRDGLSSAGAERRGLPEKGRLVEAVMGAGPLLQTLLLAGPLPEWRHPPPAMQSFEIPSFGIDHSTGRSLKWERQEELVLCTVSPASSLPSPSSDSPETNGSSSSSSSSKYQRIVTSMLM